MPRDKNDQICTTALYIHSYILRLSYVSEIQYIHKMLGTAIKHLLTTGGQLKVFLGPCG